MTLKVGDRIKFSGRALAMGFGKARSGYFRQHPEERRGFVVAVRTHTVMVHLDGTEAGQEFAKEYIEAADVTRYDA